MDERGQPLSEKQKICLRLVGRGMSSKEIAQETGLSPQTVDTYVKAAMARLGASNRREAARLLALADLSQKSGSPTLAVAGSDRIAQQQVVADRRWDGSTFLPPIGGLPNDLSPAARTYAVLRVAAVAAATLIAIALLLAGALRAFR